MLRGGGPPGLSRDGVLTGLREIDEGVVATAGMDRGRGHKEAAQEGNQLWHSRISPGPHELTRHDDSVLNAFRRHGFQRNTLVALYSYE